MPSGLKKESIRTLWDQKSPMRDGVLLSADVYLPPAGLEGGPYPTVLIRTPYDNQHPLWVKQSRSLAMKGYAAVIQDVRGRHDSEGEFYPFHYEREDGYDTVEWVAAQPWSNGKVGMMGGSYDGWVQWAAASQKPPHLVTLLSSCAAGRWMEEVPFTRGLAHLFMFSWLNLVGGRVQQNNALVDWERVMFHLPLRTMDKEVGREKSAWQDWLDHPVLDEYWSRSVLTPEEFSRIDIPVLHVTGWYDGDQAGSLFFYEGMMKNSPAPEKQHLLVGPWGHTVQWTPTTEIGGVDFGPESIVGSEDLESSWFDRWLKDEENEFADQKRVRYFLMGSNEWRNEDQLPSTSEVAFYLHSDGAANTLRGDGRLEPEPQSSSAVDVLAYNPDDPASSMVGMEVFTRSGGGFTLDRRRNESRDDVLVYTSELLEDPISVVGRPWVTLFGSSDCEDTDWVVALTDVAPDGRSNLLSEGFMRARFRDSIEEEAFMRPGEIYRFEIEMSALAHVLKAGHRIRLAVTSSAFPLYDRNPNVGLPIGAADKVQTAINSVYHDDKNQSCLRLPVTSEQGRKAKVA